MYLRELEINGFKSFADSTALDLHPGVTVIVGPNGCGKSNLSDALRWVLGEQNPRQLRGTRMGDMIFNGTVNRTPEGMAEVSLTFDNTDGFLPVTFSEVKITRRLFRDGESEYMINGARCRLKEINDLFVGSGVGVSCYSIMEQGQVDRIVHAKPKQRRILIEEAAGVSRYIRRREEALRKLERTEGDLCRVEDILQELERQARSLKRQAKQAERAREYGHSLDVLERVHEVRRGRVLETQFESVEGQLKVYQEQIGGLRDELAQVRASRQERAERLEKLDAVNRERRDHFVSINGRLEQGERNIEHLRARREEYFQLRTRLAAECEEAAARVEVERNQRARIQEDLERVKKELLHFFDYLERLEGEFNEIELRLIEVQEEDEKKRHELLDGERALADAETETREWERDRTFFSMRREQMAVEATGLESELEQHHVRLHRLSDTSREIYRNLREASARARDVAGQHRNVQQRHASASDELQIVEREWHRTESRLESLVELQKNLAGYGSGVRFLMRGESGPREGLLTTLAEVLTADSGHEIAIEAALEGRLQGIVAADLDVVREAIAELNENSEGRVKFLLEGAGEAPEDVELSESLGGMHRAVDRVRASEGHGPLVERLLCRTLVAHSLDEALGLWRDLPTGWRIVTAEGECLDADGTITGGKASQSSLLMRTSEIGQLRTTLEQHDRRRRLLAEQSEFLAVRTSDLDRQREEAARQVVRLEARARNTKEETSRLREQTSRLEDHLGTLLGEKIELERALEEGAKDDAERAQRTQGLVQKKAALEEEVREWEVQIATLTERRREVHEGISAARLQRLEREKDQERWRSEIDSRTQRIEELEANIEKNTNLIAQQEERTQQVEEAVAEQQELLTELREEQAAVASELQTGESNASEVKAEMRSIVSEEERLLSQIETGDGERQEIEQKRVRLSVEREYWERRMTDLFGEDRPEQLDDERTDDEIAEEITLLRSRLERLGIVNELAIEEHEEVQGRLDTLLVQRDDLYKARSDLLHTVRELHRTTVQLFAKTFEEVQENFRTMVRRMFNGGRAELRLEEGMDPMEAGIEIEVQPPGKKLLTISLMSGGEKALTAIALMFAIYQTKPSPFCFLDEIDAPLDDTNISRFTTMLEGFLSSSQFIIITHNKRTMEIADTIYGVTMQEEGVSTVMSMQFEARKERHDAINRRSEYLRRRLGEHEAEERRMIDLDDLGRDQPLSLDGIEEEPGADGEGAPESVPETVEAVSDT